MLSIPNPDCITDQISRDSLPNCFASGNKGKCAQHYLFVKCRSYRASDTLSMSCNTVLLSVSTIRGNVSTSTPFYTQFSYICLDSLRKLLLGTIEMQIQLQATAGTTTWCKFKSITARHLHSWEAISCSARQHSIQSAAVISITSAVPPPPSTEVGLSHRYTTTQHN